MLGTMTDTLETTNDTHSISHLEPRIKMETEPMQCRAVPQNTIRRCRNKVLATGQLYCVTHSIKNHEVDYMIPKYVYHYDGSVHRYVRGTKTVVSDPKPLWVYINNQLASFGKGTSNNKIRKLLETHAKLFRSGKADDVIQELIRLDMFICKEECITFFELSTPTIFKRQKSAKTLLTSGQLENARSFLGQVYYLNIFPQKLIKLQAFVRGYIDRKKTNVNPISIKIMVKYGSVKTQILSIQRWIRHRLWLKNLPVSPLRMRKHFIPNRDKIVLIQKRIRHYIKEKVHRSFGCPYSMQNYWEIPRKYRILYRDTTAGRTHWRYYDLRWLHQDFISQCNERVAMREPYTRNDYSKDFLLEASRKIWLMTRRDKVFFREENEDNEGTDEKSDVEPDFSQDYKNIFGLRSVYGYCMVFMDILWKIKYYDTMDDVQPPEWLYPKKRNLIQSLFLSIMPELYQVSRSSGSYDLEDYIFYATQRFSSPRLLLDMDNTDEMASMMGGSLINTLYECEKSPHADQLLPIFYDIIKTNIQDIMGE